LNAKYPLPITPVLKGVRKEEDMLGKVDNLKFMDNDITDTHKFPELARDQYVCTKTDPAAGKNLVEAQAWASGLEKFRGVTKSMHVSRYWSVASMGGNFGYIPRFQLIQH
jgi:hypothetical protein